MSKSYKKFYLIILVLIIITIGLYFREKEFIFVEDNPKVTLISTDYKVNSIYNTLDLSFEEIPRELNEEIISILLNIKIRNSFLPYDISHSVDEGDTHIDIKVATEDRGSLFVHICNQQEYSSVNINDEYYSIINSKEIFEEIYDLIFGVLL